MFKDGSLKELTGEKDEIILKIKEIEQSYEGLENENNYKIILQLNEEKTNLILEEEKVSRGLNDLRNKLKENKEKIEKISSEGKEKILEAIKKQKWYFFKNKPKVLMDKNSGILWVNLDYFDYKSGESYSSKKKCEIAVKNLIIDDIENWELPKFENLKDIINDKAFPFKKGEFWSIKNWYFNIEESYYKGTNSLNLSKSDSCKYLLPCHYAMTSKEYEANIKESNKIYSESEKLNMTLDIFLKNDLEPIFDDEEITKLYRDVYIEKPKLIERLNELNKLEFGNKDKNNQLLKLISKDEFIKKYNLEESDNSLSLYYKNAEVLVEDFLEILNKLNEDKSVIKLKNNYLEFDGFILNQQLNEELNEDEKMVFKERKEFLRELINIDIEGAIKNLEKIRDEVNVVNLEIKNLIASKNFLVDLAILEERKKPSFKLFLDYSYNIVEEIVNKVSYIKGEEEKLNKVIDIDRSLTEKYIEFNKSLSIDFTKMHVEEDIAYRELEKWANEFNSKNVLIEEEISKLLKISLKGDFNLDILDSIVDILVAYKEELSNFYKKDKKTIYQKYAFETAGEEKEEVESKVQLNNINNNLESNLRKIIFNINDLNIRNKILKWSEVLMNNPIDEVIAFIKNNDSKNHLLNIMEEFDKIRKENFTAYIEDLQSYAEARVEREKQYNSLMFRLKQDLNNKK